MRTFFQILASLSLFLLVTACSGSQPVVPTNQPTANQPSPTQALDYPPPAEAAVQQPTTYPGPANANANVPAAAPTPTQDQSLGAVKGKLLEANQPAINVILYLAEVVKDSSGREMVVSYDRATSHSTTTDEQGNFVFVNTQPGKYGLILDTVIDAYLLHFPGEESKQILFTVEKGKDTDLGELNYDDLPLPPP